MAKVAVLHW